MPSPPTDPPPARTFASGRWLGLAGAALTGAACFAWVMGVGVLAPRQITWLLRGDLAQQAFGWLYFRQTPWSWPLGRIAGYLEPFGSYLAFADAYPWFAVLAKALSPLLPAGAQITGPWLLLCFAAQGAAGYLLLAELGLTAGLAALGAAFFVGSPVLIQRLDLGHATLCAQWLVIAALWLHVRCSRRGLTAKLSLGWALLLTVAAATHPYLLVMVAALAASAHGEAFCRPAAAAPARRRAVVGLGGGLAVATGVLGAFGYFTGSPSAWDGFDFFSSDVFGLINPRDRSALLPGVLKAGQYEGLAWIGAGALALAAFELLRRWRSLRPRPGDVAPAGRRLPYRALTATCLALYAFSWGTNVRFFGQWWVDLGFLYDRMPWLTGALRAPGRFAWPLHYLALAAIVAAAAEGARSRRGAVLLLVLGLGVQTADQLPFFRGRTARLAAEPGVPLTAPFWRTIGRRYRHLALVPPQLDDAHCSPTHASVADYPPHYAHSFLALAWSQGMGINSGYNPRAPLARYEAYCTELYRQLARGSLDPETLYIVDVKYRDWWAAQVGAAASCDVVEGLEVCTATGTRGVR